MLRAGDDAAGLGISVNLEAQIRSYNQGVRNANDGLSTLQIKDGALNNISTLLDRLATLATQAASGSTSDASRVTLNQEFQDVLAEIQRESDVASLTSSSGFSVFISNETTTADGVVTGTIGAAGGAPPGREGRNLDHFCVRIETFEPAALAAHLSAHGVDPGTPSERYGADGFGPSLYITDPDGNTVELKGPPLRD